MYNLKYFFYTFILFSLFLFSSCSSTPEIETTLPSKIATNICRISGTIVNIDEAKKSSGPCSIHPCVASVEINNVIETGFGFSTPLIKGNKIKVTFAYTLSETSKELFPTLNYTLPGLKIGDSFIGDIEQIQAIQLDKNSAKFEYRIFNYDNIN
ncbi:MAG: hypothetical protein PF445_01515 [Melioribacteraceae bacterium]|jgi:hypothetical protein|nr:hypothetical protein [Melioribacteraceae bacterium]